MIIPYLALGIQIIVVFTTFPVLAFEADDFPESSPQQKDDLFADIDTLQPEDEEKQNEEPAMEPEDGPADDEVTVDPADMSPKGESILQPDNDPSGDEISTVQLEDKGNTRGEETMPPGDGVMKIDEDAAQADVDAIPISAVLPSFEDITQSEGASTLQSDETSQTHDDGLSPRDENLIRELIEVLKLPMKLDASKASSSKNPAESNRKNDSLVHGVSGDLKSGVQEEPSIGDVSSNDTFVEPKDEEKGVPLPTTKLDPIDKGEDMMLTKEMEPVEVAPDSISDNDNIFSDDLDSDNSESDQPGPDISNNDIGDLGDPLSKGNEINEADVIPGPSSDDETNDETGDVDEDSNNPSADENADASETPDFNIPAEKSNDENLQPLLGNKKLAQYLLDKINSMKSKRPTYNRDEERDDEDNHR